jgi:hypothetical protein
VWMHGHDLDAGIAENYRAFAEEARGRSPAYERLATAVCDDPAVLGFLGSLPPAKRQPNLLFAAARYLLGGTPDPDGLRALAIRDARELAGVITARRTQTNEPARCATLLPALALLPQPLALIEAGAIATARRAPPHVHRGDLLTGLPELAGQAPAGATLVIYHSAVLAYLTPGDRRRFAATARALPAVWLSNEGPGVVPGQPIPPYRGVPFVLARNGDTILALTDSHGTWLQWLPARAA